MLKFFKASALTIAAAGLAGTAVPASAASVFDAFGVQPVANGAPAAWQHGRDRDWRRDYRGSWRDRRYYDEPVYANTRVWRGRDGRYYCRKKDGTTGLIIGGAVGALLGREIDGGYNRSLGTILGAVGGALLGREVARSGGRCR